MTHTQEEIDQLRQQLKRLDPSPFVELLIEGLLERPTPEEWRKFAAQAPDKYVKAMKQVSAIIGFSEKISIAHVHKHHLVLEEMNDLELIQHIQRQRLALPLLPVIEGEAQEVTEGPASHGPSDADLRDAGIVPKKGD